MEPSFSDDYPKPPQSPEVARHQADVDRERALAQATAESLRETYPNTQTLIDMSTFQFSPRDGSDVAARVNLLFSNENKPIGVMVREYSSNVETASYTVGSPPEGGGELRVENRIIDAEKSVGFQELLPFIKEGIDMTLDVAAQNDAVRSLVLDLVFSYNRDASASPKTIERLENLRSWFDNFTVDPGELFDNIN